MYQVFSTYSATKIDYSKTTAIDLLVFTAIFRRRLLEGFDITIHRSHPIADKVLVLS
jgi:hypothetical protein